MRGTRDMSKAFEMALFVAVKDYADKYGAKALRGSCFSFKKSMESDIAEQCRKEAA